MVRFSSFGTTASDGPRQRLGRGVDTHVFVNLGFAGLMDGRVSYRLVTGVHGPPYPRCAHPVHINTRNGAVWSTKTL